MTSAVSGGVKGARPQGPVLFAVDQEFAEGTDGAPRLEQLDYEIGTCSPQVGQLSEGMGLDELQREHKTLPSPRRNGLRTPSVDPSVDSPCSKYSGGGGSSVSRDAWCAARSRNDPPASRSRTPTTREMLIPPPVAKKSPTPGIMSRPPMIMKPLAQPFVLVELLNIRPFTPISMETSTESKGCLRPSGSATATQDRGRPGAPEVGARARRVLWPKATPSHCRSAWPTFPELSQPDCYGGSRLLRGFQR
jgi:hypothetical protein